MTDRVIIGVGMTLLWVPFALLALAMQKGNQDGSR